MSDMKCPICNSNLIITRLCDGIFPNPNKGKIDEIFCDKCKMHGTEELWQELIRTRKALEIAVDLLKRIDETRSGVKENLHATNGRTLNAGNGFCWATIDDIHNALEQITALEQKENKI